MANLKNTIVQGTVLTLPVGNSAQRPSAQQGVLRFNTDISQPEFSDSLSWFQTDQIKRKGLGGIAQAYTINDQTYIIHAFYEGESTFQVLETVNIDVLLVGGGGGGGGGGTGGGGGGGGGGVVLDLDRSMSPGEYSINVGSGGSKGLYLTSNTGRNGGNSSFNGLFALGGGGGGGSNEAGVSGGSGGGHGQNRSGGGSGLQPGTNPSATIDAGNDGQSYQFSGNNVGGGGGGAGEPGHPYSSEPIQVADGGDGLNFAEYFTSQFGDKGFFGGGGAGSENDTIRERLSRGGRGALGGGGSKDRVPPSSSKPPLPNTGGGGSGSGLDTDNGTDGAAGIILIRYIL